MKILFFVLSITDESAYMFTGKIWTYMKTPATHLGSEIADSICQAVSNSVMTSQRRAFSQPHFTDEKMEVQRTSVTCPQFCLAILPLQKMEILSLIKKLPVFHSVQESTEVIN